MKPETPHQLISQRVIALRGRRGWTQEQLAEAMRAAGMTGWTRLVVTKFENYGYRRSITVEELLALAYVLDVAPIHLMLPVDGGQATYPVVPDVEVEVDQAREWARGYAPLPSQNARTYLAERPLAELRPSAE